MQLNLSVSGVPGRLTSGHVLVTTLTNSKRHALLRVLGVLTQPASPQNTMASSAEQEPELPREKFGTLVAGASSDIFPLLGPEVGSEPAPATLTAYGPQHVASAGAWL